MAKSKLAGVILSAGRSERMGRPKALLEIGGRTFLEKIVELATDAGLKPIKIVVSYHGDNIKTRHPKFAGMLLENDQPELGQLHSLHLALRSLPGRCSGVVVFLVDHPRVKPETLDRMIAEFQSGPAEIVLPVHAGRRGHPVIFGRGVFPDLLAAPLCEGAREVVHSRSEVIAEVEVDDPGIHADIDTPSDYEELKRE
jgi:molybdenum cofactor cytidylyltransferase